VGDNRGSLFFCWVCVSLGVVLFLSFFFYFFSFFFVVCSLSLKEGVVGLELAGSRLPPRRFLSLITPPDFILFPPEA